VSKQPHFKYSAVKIQKAGQGVFAKIENTISEWATAIHLNI